MAAHLDPTAQPFGDASDMQLVEYTRAGSTAAFGELWLRHSKAGRAVARSHRFDADDLLSEAFARIFQAISAGGGPTAAFRPYLFTTIRNVSMQWARAKSADASEDLDLIADPSTEEDASLAALDKSLTVNAFRSLPTRWQEALWYSEVEQLTSAEIAPLLGMKANAVSALTYRAREGLRQAWILAHLKRTTDPECEATIERLGSFTRGMLGTRESKRVRDHLATCTSCTIVADEARQVGSRLALVLLPLAAGVSGAAGFLSWLQTGGDAAGGLVAAASAPAHNPMPAGRSSAPARSAGSASTTTTAAGATAVGTAGLIGTAAGALALAAAVVAAVTLGPALFTAPADEASAAADVSNDARGGGSDAGDPVDSEGAVPVAPTPTPAPPASTTPPTPAGPTTEPSPRTQTPRSPSPITGPSEPAAAPGVASTTSPPDPQTGPTEPPTPTATPTPTPTPTPTVEPTTPPVEPEPAPGAPTVSVEQADDRLTFPAFSGIAEPLSTVQILDTDGSPLASTTAADDGTWSISDFTSSITADPAGRQVVVRQVVDGVASAPSEPQQLVVLEAPTIENPLEGATVPVGSTYDVSVVGVPGASIQRLVNGEVRDDIQVIGADGVWTQAYGAPEATPIELGMRYYDPQTGRFGLTRFISYTIG